ncbi:MAG: diguanylate cyclase [Sulfuricella denitrificans]|nr:diguanylate cyclase [Sulfuricella denitrificans]
MLDSDDNGKLMLRLRLWFLVPLTVVLLAAILLIVMLIRHHAYQDIDHNTERLSALSDRLYRDQIELTANMLGATMEVLSTDAALRRALQQRDRESLQQRAEPLFATLKKKYGITHLYFSGPDRVNLLRAHQPERFGDTIDRVTTLQAERGRQTAYGVELGPLGTFTLRLVTPWFGARGELQGYVELGMEIDHVLRQIQYETGVKTFILIDKKFLERKRWEEGMRMMGRKPDWERLPDMVVNIQAQESLPAEFSHILSRQLDEGEKMMSPLESGISAYRMVIQPISDAAGRTTGKLLLLIDVSQQTRSVGQMIQYSLWVAVSAFLILWLLFFRLVSGVGRQLQEDQNRLQELATHDGLTGLLNHRMYYLNLEEELARSWRTGRPVSLLLLDIDHFKLVNDRYGHLAGDKALKIISEQVRHACRQIDIPCRYGGEEIAVILPETDAASARISAERLRRTIEKYVFEFEDSAGVHITVSIGVASSAEPGATSASLTSHADNALYRAKEGGRNRVVCAAACNGLADDAAAEATPVD